MVTKRGYPCRDIPDGLCYCRCHAVSLAPKKRRRHRPNAYLPSHDALVRAMVELLARGLTDAGHVAQLVPQEHRGNCTVRGCTPLCQQYGAVLDAARAWLESHAEAGG